MPALDIEKLKVECQYAKALYDSAKRRLEAAQKTAAKKDLKFNKPNRFIAKQLKKAS